MSIKRLDPSKTYEIISETDSALDNESPAELEQLKAEGKKSRFAQYIERYDLNILKFKDNQKPDLFVVRSMLNSERADINGRQLNVDVEAKKVSFKNQQLMMFEVFNLCVEGIKTPDGKVEKVSANQVPHNVALEIGAAVIMLSELSAEEKK